MKRATDWNARRNRVQRIEAKQWGPDTNQYGGHRRREGAGGGAASLLAATLTLFTPAAALSLPSAITTNYNWIPINSARAMRDPCAFQTIIGGQKAASEKCSGKSTLPRIALPETRDWRYCTTTLTPPLANLFVKLSTTKQKGSIL